MTDLHTHILPGVDDGAKTVQDSLAMLRHQYAQGIDTVALTPHFYPDMESYETFLTRRNLAWEELKQAILALPQEERGGLPRLVLGAEVAYTPGLQEKADLRKLCIGNTKNLLLELPFYLWDTAMMRQLYVFLERAGVTPVLAHIERYIPIQKKQFLDEILELGLPVQVGTDLMSRGASPVLRLLKQGRAHLIASDCHNMANRSPNLGAAFQIAQKKLGNERCEELIELADQLAVEE